LALPADIKAAWTTLEGTTESPENGS
jgi:hypothetical protein